MLILEAPGRRPNPLKRCALALLLMLVLFVLAVATCAAWNLADRVLGRYICGALWLGCLYYGAWLLVGPKRRDYIQRGKFWGTAAWCARRVDAQVVLETRCGCRRIISGVDPRMREWTAPLRIDPHLALALATLEGPTPPTRPETRLFRWYGDYDEDTTGLRIFREVA